MVTLVLGGVRSGKSRYAQTLAERAENVLFVATLEHRDDAEMRAKIERHRAERPALCAALEESSRAVIPVSNEVGSGVVPEHPLGRRFRDLLGELIHREWLRWQTTWRIWWRDFHWR